jgi:hypothetical protein
MIVATASRAGASTQASPHRLYFQRVAKYSMASMGCRPPTAVQAKIAIKIAASTANPTTSATKVYHAIAE